MAFSSNNSSFILLVIVSCVISMQANAAVQERFDAYYSPLWGLDHISLNPQQTEAQLTFDQSSGAGFRSKSDYGSGVFRLKMKLPDKKTGGILTSFYLTSAPDGQDPGNHFEIDFEFLGTNGTVQTNVYDNDGGHREQSFKLWFDPSKDFHTYSIIWNSAQILFTVDSIPIRVFKNNLAHGVAYPTSPMHVEASIWNADWAGQVDWSQSPFVAHYQDFGIYGCRANNRNIGACVSTKFFWNRSSYLGLNAWQRRTMESFRRAYMSYDYCWKQSTRKPECFLGN